MLAHPDRGSVAELDPDPVAANRRGASDHLRVIADGEEARPAALALIKSVDCGHTA